MTMVANLIDNYHAQVASIVNLKLEKFRSLAATVLDYARPMDDGMYRAVDIYLKAEKKRQNAADVMFQYSNFVMACIGFQAPPCDMRLHLMKEISGMPASLNRETSQVAASPDAMGETSSSDTTRLDKADSFHAL